MNVSSLKMSTIFRNHRVNKCVVVRHLSEAVQAAENNGPSSHSNGVDSPPTKRPCKDFVVNRIPSFASYTISTFKHSGTQYTRLLKLLHRLIQNFDSPV